MRNITFIFVLCFAFVGFAQENSKLQGKIVADTLQVSVIHIINTTQKLGVVSDQNGYFEINADVGDVIHFSSVEYTSKTHKVRSEDLDNDDFVVRLEFFVNQLDEVIISQYSLSGDVKKDLKMIPTYEQNLPLWNAAELKRLGVEGFNDAQSPVKNYALGDEMKATPIDLMGLVDLVNNTFRKKKIFTEVSAEITDFYTEELIVEELKIPIAEYYNFLDYINEQAEMQELLRIKDDLKILEFLMRQAIAYKVEYNIKE
ncbi:carboxypeptidase-like regulatory domain-containing protein [Aquimarina sp. MMG016]|uniref:carboxypeptidase-like regulatory domain-containing protein n=1 Tax=Aquimarina sp. MMG016 TaxID=2822690 RepID=UPI001B3A1A52|nr:carboxypeptidase-like regulatory domain-containing protein [Aquimarina sp. MMG016]MBQ4818824.1 carboxypeptidase-like regulatory domain-containing protein [Aquimarina sp. MMG016]